MSSEPVKKREPPPTPAEASALILRRCRALGFARAGIAAADSTHYESELRQWLAAGRHGEMHYLAKYEDLLLDPTRLVPGARSVICVADRYATGENDAPSTGSDSPRGLIARYARGDDYHRVIRRRLHDLCDELSSMFPEETFRACVDTAPLLEREYAQRAGLGAVGKHTLLIQRGVGSWLLLGEIVTTLELSVSEPAPPDPCGTCTRCIDACPTDAITPWSVDATKCISYLTIEHRSPIEQRYHEAIGEWIFGCDICQEVCPHNQPTGRAQAAPTHEAYRPRHESLGLLEVLNWTEDDRRQTFTKSAMKRAKLAMMKRNALIAAANAITGSHPSRPVLRQRIAEIADDATEPELVRATARTVLHRLQS